MWGHIPIFIPCSASYSFIQVHKVNSDRVPLSNDCWARLNSVRTEKKFFFSRFTSFFLGGSILVNLDRK